VTAAATAFRGSDREQQTATADRDQRSVTEISDCVQGQSPEVMTPGNVSRAVEVPGFSLRIL